MHPMTERRIPRAEGLGVAEWLSLGALAIGTLHILLDFGVGLFPLQGPVAPVLAAAIVLNSLMPVWWAVSIADSARGGGGGLASLAVLGVGWTLLTNGYPIVFCPPPCAAAAPLGDVAHLGSIALGVAAPAAALWALWRRRPPLTWGLPAGAAALVVATIVALANSPLSP